MAPPIRLSIAGNRSSYCRAGVGRTGTLITIINSLQYFAQNRSQKYNQRVVLDVINEFVQFYRTRRVYMIQNREQFMYTFRTTLALLQNL